MGRASTLRRRATWRWLLALEITVLLAANTGAVFTAANTVPASRGGQQVRALDPDEMKPPECAGLDLAAIVVGGSGTAANELLIGTSSTDSLTGGDGDDCILGGAGADTLSGGAGTDVCIGGDGGDAYPDGSCETIADLTLACPATTTTVTADEDTYVDEAAPSSNQGAATTLQIAGTNNSRRRALVQFPLPSLPLGCSITGAALRITTSSSQATTLHAFQAGAAWTEGGATWLDLPGPAGSPASATAALGTVQWDVTTIVRRLYDGTDAGFVLQDHLDGSGNNRAQVAGSREHAMAASRPQLDVSFGPGSSADTLAPVVMDLQLTNLGSTAGRPELGDRITITYSEPLAPSSVLAGWSGAATNVVVTGTNGGGVTGDSLTIRNASNTLTLPLGTIRTGGDLFTGSPTFGASGTPSSMTMSGSAIVITLGTPAGTMRTATAARTLLDTASGPTDVVGNALDQTDGTESGAFDVDL